MTSELPNDSRLDELARSLRIEPDTQPLWDRLNAALDPSPGVVRESSTGARAPGLGARSVRARGLRASVAHWRTGGLIAAGLLALASLASFEIERGRSALLASGGEAQAFEGELARLDAAIRAHRGDLANDEGSGERPGVTGQLAYLETNIEHCRELLLVNARNRDVQRSLLRSVRQKEELLRTLIEPETKHETL